MRCLHSSRRSISGSVSGFSLLELSLALAILAVVALYSVDFYQEVRARKQQMDDQERMERIVTAMQSWYSGHESLPGSTSMGTVTDIVPVTLLGLGQSYRFDTFGRPFRYFPGNSATALTVDNRPAAGVLISLGGNQRQEYTVNGNQYLTGGDDILMPIEVHVEAVAITLAELEALGKRVEAYNREFAGIQENPDTDYYGDTDAGAPPILDPDHYDAHFADHPELYPYRQDYSALSDRPYLQPEASWPGDDDTTLFPAGPPPTFSELVQGEPDGWPGAGAYDNNFLNNWEADLAPTSAANWVWPDTGTENPKASGTRPQPPNYVASDPAYGFFGVYPGNNSDNTFGTDDDPVYLGSAISALRSYRLIDEGGCVNGSVDANCGYVDLDQQLDPLSFIRTRYGLDTRSATDPWGNPYYWGNGNAIAPDDPRYHLFYSAGPDGQPGTTDDVILF